jgi:hypothetical protein
MEYLGTPNATGRRIRKGLDARSREGVEQMLAEDCQDATPLRKGQSIWTSSEKNSSPPAARR